MDTTLVSPDDITAAISGLISGYSGVQEPELRASARAQILGLLDRLALEKKPLTCERIDSTRFQADPSLRGAIRAHIDLAFRSSLTPSELLAVCTRGVLRVAWHPDVGGFPIGVALALPSALLPRSSADLFVEEGRMVQGSPLLILSALATNPARLGAAAMLIRHLLGDCAQASPKPRLVAFSPLTGLRARVLKTVTNDSAWAEVGGAHPELDSAALAALREQVLALLDREKAPPVMAEPLRGWLAEEARQFAHSSDYVVGRFHRNLGAVLVGVAHAADPNDSDALWARGLFDYPNDFRPTKRPATLTGV